jgi:hypothetical protein
MIVVSESPKKVFPEPAHRISAIRLRERWPDVVRVLPIHARRTEDLSGRAIDCPEDETPESASSRLLGDGHRLSVDFLEYQVTAALEKRLAHFTAESLGILAVP